MMAHARDPVVPPSQVKPGVPQDLEQVILRCLAKKPSDRYPTVKALGEALAACESAARLGPESGRRLVGLHFQHPVTLVPRESRAMRIDVGFLGVLLLSASVVLAQGRPGGKSTPDAARGGPEATSTEQTAETRAIGELLQAFLKAYNAKDAKALGAFFTQNAEIQDEDGDITRGRGSIIARFAQSSRQKRAAPSA